MAGIMAGRVQRAKAPSRVARKLNDLIVFDVPVDFEIDLSVRAASNGFFDISGTGRSATAVRIRDQSGNFLPAFFQVWIVRVE